jgi:hypothetical protein
MPSDHALILSNDSEFIARFPSIPSNLQFADTQNLYRFLDENDERMVIILDKRPEGFPGWSKSSLVIVFHDYSNSSDKGLYDAKDVHLAFNFDDDNAYDIVNQIIETMIL